MKPQKKNKARPGTLRDNAGNNSTLAVRIRAPRGAKRLVARSIVYLQHGNRAPRGARKPCCRSLCLLQPYIPALIYLANDVEKNPGPHPKYPCGICNKAVTWTKPAIACDICNCWFHKRCLNMQSVIFTALSKTDASWTCCNCGIPNFSSSLFDTTEAQNNSDTASLDTSHHTSPGIPMHTSSPKIQRRQNSSRTQHTKIMVINFQSIKNKKAEFNNLLDSADANIIIGTETWLRPEIKSSEIFPDYYNIYRKDRKDGYGGVLIAAKDDITSEELKTGQDIEAVFIKLSIPGIKAPLIVGSLYRPPTSNIDYMEAIYKEVREQTAKHQSSIFWIGGDLNLPDINWTTESVSGNRNPSTINARFLEMIHDCSLEQIVDYPTRLDATLDLFLTNRPSLVNRSQPLPGISDHDIPFIDTSLKALPSKPISRKIYIWKRANIPNMIKDSEKMNIEFHQNYSSSSSIEEMWSFISSSLLQLMDEHIPTKMSSTRNHQPWITGDIKRLSRRKKKAFIKARTTKNPQDFQRYRKLKTSCKKACRQAHTTYLHNIISQDLTESPKKFWSYIKGKNCDNNGVAPLKGADGLTYSDKLIRANLLNQQFSSVFNQNEDTNSIKDKGPSPYTAMPNINITIPGVYKLLKNLKIHKATGPDSIPTRLLKTVASQIAPTLTTFFQISVNQGMLPKQWKQANVVPIFKKGDRSSAANYRPVSLTSVCCKLLEHIISSSIMKHLEQFNILTDAQHGFRKARSCETQLILTLHDLAKGIDTGDQLDVILLDFSKAFDKVPHERLLHKIKHYGIQDNTLEWLRDFLSGRNQKVLVEGKESSTAPVLSGVPQGSVLGPLMFLIYINDLPEYIKSSTVRLFADDCVIYKKITSQEDGISLQQDLDRLQQWERDWLMEFHPQKCQLLRITNKRQPTQTEYKIHGHTLDNVEEAKYLGITIQRCLNWNTHISNITKKANSTKAFLQRNMSQCSTKAKAACYEYLVRPLLEYACTTWDPWTKKNIDKIEAVQRRAARFVMGDYSRYSSVTAMLSKLNWSSLSERRARFKAIMMHRIVNHQVAINPEEYLTPSTAPSRGHTNKYLLPYARTQVFKYSFFPSAIKIWNAIPEEVINQETIEAFKRSIQKHRLAV